MRIPTHTASALLLLIGVGCRQFTVLHRASDFGAGTRTPGCEGDYSTTPGLDCCTTVQSAWATSEAELEAVMADQVGFGPGFTNVATPPGFFDDRAALALWTDACPGSDARLRVRSFDAQPDDVSVDLLVALPGIDQEIEGIRPVIVLATDRDHAGKPVSATAQYP